MARPVRSAISDTWSASEQLGVRSAGHCAVCDGLLTRGMHVRREIGGTAKIHAVCAPGRGAPAAITADLIGDIYANPPANARQIAIRARLSKSAVARRLQQLLEAGIVRRAGDVYRPDRAQYPTSDAAIAAWSNREK